MKRVFFLIAFYLIAGGMTLASAQGSRTGEFRRSSPLRLDRASDVAGRIVKQGHIQRQ
jgi:hypothetical protein